jgi:hypothetical protein
MIFIAGLSSDDYFWGDVINSSTKRRSSIAEIGYTPEITQLNLVLASVNKSHSLQKTVRCFQSLGLDA